MVKIKVLDIVHSQVVGDGVAEVTPCLSYKTTFYRWSKSRGRRIPQEYVKSLITKKGVFPTGLLPRVRSYLKKKGMEYKVVGRPETLTPDSEPRIKGKKLRDDQLELIHNFTTKGRGVILSPTGTGKTLVVGAIFSCYKKAKKLWLCHTRTLLKQAVSDFEEYGLTDVSICTEGKVDLSGNIVLATRQTFININPDQYADLFDVVIIDEAHHIPDEYAEYSRILNNMLAPVRGGVTATYPGGRAARLAIEGFVGRVVGEFSIEEAIKKGILATPKIKVLRTKIYTDIKELRKYQDVVEQGIIQNEDRNELIIKETAKFLEKGQSVLILVNRIDHGENLFDIAKEMGLNVPFVQGATDSTERERLRHALNRKEILGAIATSVWKEGVNIPSLDVILLAHIGKKELAVLQAVGRGMRSTKTKTTVTVVDIFDPSHTHLIKHFGYRLSYYCERGWM